MNLKEYKEAMNDISVEAPEIKKLVQRKRNYTARKIFLKKLPAYAFIILLPVMIIIYSYLASGDTKITITAYAQDSEEIPLTNDFVTIQTKAAPFSGMVMEDDNNSFVNYNINFRCKGKGIDSITYRCSNETEPVDMLKVPAYFVENTVIPIDESADKVTRSRLNTVTRGYTLYDKKVNVTKAIGSSYTVSYKEQSNKQYGLIVDAAFDDKYNVKVKNVIIHVSIHMKDGTIQEKQLLLQAGNNPFKEFKIKLLK